MELKPGYKMTEIGLLPDDWTVKSLQMVADRIMVGIASAATHAYRDHGIVLFRNQNIKPVFLDDSDILYVTPEYEITFKNKRLRPGDLLTARTGYPGTTCLVPDKYDGSQSFTTLITRPNTHLVDSAYLCWFINSERGQIYFEQNQIGGGQKNVNAGSLKHLPLALPPTKAEQEAIAEALGDTDRLIESIERLIAKKRHVKQAAMQQLLTGHRRLPGFTGEWRIKHLGDVAIADPENLGSQTRPNYEFKYISLDDVDCGILRNHTEQVFQNAPSRARRKLRRNDILVATVRPNLLSHLLFSKESDNWVCSTGFCVLRCHPGIAEPYFVLSHMFSDGVKHQIDGLLTGSNYPAINRRDVEALRIPIPEFGEQAAIVSVLSDMDEEIAKLDVMLEKTRCIKHGMMQNLLTGKIRLV